MVKIICRKIKRHNYITRKDNICKRDMLYMLQKKEKLNINNSTLNNELLQLGFKINKTQRT